MAKLTEGQVEQIKVMREDGKKQSEIKEFFKDSYGINLTNNNVSYPSIAKVPGKRHYTKRELEGQGKPKDVTHIIIPAQQGKPVDEFSLLIRKAFDIHKGDFFKRVEQVVGA